MQYEAELNKQKNQRIASLESTELNSDLTHPVATPVSHKFTKGGIRVSLDNEPIVLSTFQTAHRSISKSASSDSTSNTRPSKRKEVPHQIYTKQGSVKRVYQNEEESPALMEQRKQSLNDALVLAYSDNSPPLKEEKHKLLMTSKAAA